MFGLRCLLGMVSCLAMISCQHDPFASEYTVTRPEVADIVGTYRITEIYLPMELATLEKAMRNDLTTEIEVRGDGHVAYRHLPWLNKTADGFNLESQGYQSGESHWTMDGVGSIGGSFGGRRIHYGLRLETMAEPLSTLSFLGKKKVTGLIIGLGDPDSGDGMVFTKQ
jgi:hypothetical protein